MQFRVIPGGPVAPAVDTSYNPAIGIALRTPMVRLVNAATGTLATGVTPNVTRGLTLNEIMGMKMKVGGVQFPGGPLEILVNNTKWTGQIPDQMNPPDPNMMGPPVNGLTVTDIAGNYISELPQEGTTEVWEIINLTADAHPIHTHLAQFQLLNRQTFDVAKYTAAYNATFLGGGIDPATNLPYLPGVFMPGYGPPLAYNTPNVAGAIGGNPDVTPFFTGLAVPPNPNEAGWKDTIMVPPGTVTRFVVRWAPTTIPVGGNPADLHYSTEPNWGNYSYVWHCHIVDHEDNEMMRPDQVVPMIGAPRTYIQGIDY
jgi:FtsP/CotA-like multicopper oxidase with cupredoxin domain